MQNFLYPAAADKPRKMLEGAVVAAFGVIWKTAGG